MSFIAAITQSKLLCSEIVEGAYDATLFEEYLFRMLKHVRSDPELAGRTVVLFMDNAIFHHHSAVLETCRKFKVNVLFNAQYSPWLNPIE
jgi:transposase